MFGIAWLLNISFYLCGQMYVNCNLKTKSLECERQIKC